MQELQQNHPWKSWHIGAWAQRCSSGMKGFEGAGFEEAEQSWVLETPLGLGLFCQRN